MKKNVYLFALDSVRTTQKEVESALFALYDEIVLNGNNVIISFNQLTDSKVFLSMLEEKGEDSFDLLLYLFAKGYIRFSQYGTTRTTSQYVQDAIKKNLSNPDNGFIFSVFPVKKTQRYLLKLMERALLCADLSEINYYLTNVSNNSRIKEKLFCDVDVNGCISYNKISTNEAETLLLTIKRFLKLILSTSINENSANPPITGDTNQYRRMLLTEFIDVVVKLKPPKDINGNIRYYWEKSIECINSIRCSLTCKANNDVNSRTVWHTELKAKSLSTPEQKVYQIAECIVDLCYNYTVEHSIWGVSKHYNSDNLLRGDDDSFANDFFSRLHRDWDYGTEANKRFLRDDNNHWSPYTGKKPDWNLGKFILQTRIIPTYEKPVTNIPQYEYQYKKERIQSIVPNISYFLAFGVIALIAIAATIGLNEHLSKVQEKYYQSLLVLFFYVFNDGLFHVINKSFNHLVKFSSTKLKRQIETLGELDILLSISNFIKATRVVCFLLYALRKENVYVCLKNAHNCSFTQLPNIQPPKMATTKAYQEYEHLYKICGQELFGQSKQISIVEPDPNIPENLTKIQDFELRTEKTIGVVYKSKYNQYIVDLIVDGQKYYTYERLVPTVRTGAVVAIPIYNDKFVLLKQFRHALRDYQWAFPRGYGETGLNGTENARKELEEELGATITREPQYLGQVVADSGICGNYVSVYAVHIDSYTKCLGYEGIVEVKTMSEADLEYAISANEILDGYTLSAYLMYLTVKKKTTSG